MLFAAPGRTYQLSPGPDRDGDGRVTTREAAAAVSAKLAKGLRDDRAG